MSSPERKGYKLYEYLLARVMEMRIEEGGRGNTNFWMISYLANMPDEEFKEAIS